ncbi:MAG TPA: 4Fe-4S dicluster domain-containing protein [Anaeromyxobacteraceae bacterium]|nr:4Fe-4S dicluster domain-containing protein [Anaeromyxobacteraceae bacterium]
MNAGMHRAIVDIDETLCDGCGECVPSCAEGAIQVVGGKARLVGDALCDGLGACLGDCPRGAIRVTIREAVPFDEAAVARHLAVVGRAVHAPAPPPAAPPVRRGLSVVQGPPAEGGCPGSRSVDRGPARPAPAAGGAPSPSGLSHWPVQLGLVSPRAPWLAGADLLLAADCVPFAYADFHRDLLAGRRVLVGCPKLDDLQAHAARLAEVLSASRPRSLTVARMEVPCCGGISWAAREAVRLSGVDVRVDEVTIATDGRRVAPEARAPGPLPG